MTLQTELGNLPALRARQQSDAIRRLVHKSAAGESRTPEDLELIQSLIANKSLTGPDEFQQIVDVYHYFPAKVASVDAARAALDAMDTEAVIRQDLATLEDEFLVHASAFQTTKKELLDRLRVRIEAATVLRSDEASLHQYAGRGGVWALVFGRN